MKCKPGNMVMAEAVPFGQRWTYHSKDPMEAMLDPAYFMSISIQLRAGDEIRLVRTEDDTVAEFADVMVTKGGRSLEFFVLRQPTSVNQKTESPQEEKPRRGQRNQKAVDSLKELAES